MAQKQNKNELIELLEIQSKRLNFLNQAIAKVEEECLINPTLEVEFIDNEFADLLEELKNATAAAYEMLLKAKIAEEEVKLNNLIKQLNEIN